MGKEDDRVTGYSDISKILPLKDKEPGQDWSDSELHSVLVGKRKVGGKLGKPVD